MEVKEVVRLLLLMDLRNFVRRWMKIELFGLGTVRRIVDAISEGVGMRDYD